LLNTSSCQGFEVDKKTLDVDKGKRVKMGNLIGGCSKRKRQEIVREVKKSNEKKRRKPTYSKFNVENLIPGGSKKKKK
jgi:hypothetical protein